MIRIGHGYDAHRLTEGRDLILGGVTIPFDRGLLGHSDADVLLHALSDAILGALALGDIGHLFPDTADWTKDMSSMLILEECRQRAEKLGYRIGNCDCTILAQKPKLAGFLPEMRQRIADCLRVDVNCVSVKATTEEKMGFTGREEGISAHAVVLLVSAEN